MNVAVKTAHIQRVCSGVRPKTTAVITWERGIGELKKLKYALAAAAMMVVSIALIAMITLQILDIRQLTLKQVGTAILTLAACASTMGGYKK